LIHNILTSPSEPVLLGGELHSLTHLWRPWGPLTIAHGEYKCHVSVVCYSGPSCNV